MITWVDFDAVLTGSSLGTRILRFNSETKLTKTVQKLSKNSRSRLRGRSHNGLPEYATLRIRHKYV